MGTHVSALPERCLREAPAIDIVVRGEYETPLAALCHALESGVPLARVPGISWRNGAAITANADAALLADLNKIPPVNAVYRRFLDYRQYYFAAAGSPGVMLMTGRGCPNRCTWCVFSQTLHGKTYRFRSPANLVEEFEYIIANFPDIKELWLDCDTFTADKNHVRAVCQGILDRKFRFQKHPFRWYCNARPPLDIETMRLMRQAGCRLFVVGFESGDDTVLRVMRKGFTVAKAEAFMGNARRAGILVHGCFVVGNPGETRDTMEATLGFCKRLRPDSAQFYFIPPYPGTA